jgi:lipoprotein-anchoring transpeptidase ErfK/SrfK
VIPTVTFNCKTASTRRITIASPFSSSYVKNGSTIKLLTREYRMRRNLKIWAMMLTIVTLPYSVNAQNAGAVTSPVPAEPPATTPTPKPAPKPTPKPVPAKPVAAKKKVAPPDALRPGQYVWEKRAYQAKNLKIIAVLDIQRIYVFDNDELVAFSTISSGKKGHATPPGIFKILQKNVDHKSNIYDNAPMPYMQRLTWDGIALHAGAIPGYPASHGCVRLPLSFAKALYQITKMDQTVMVLADLSTPPPKPDPVPEPAPAPEPPVVAPPAVEPSVPVTPPGA